VPSLYNPQALNRFGYVYNRPVVFNDPTGHCPIICVVAVLVAAAFLIHSDVQKPSTSEPISLNIIPLEIEKKFKADEPIGNINPTDTLQIISRTPIYDDTVYPKEVIGFKTIAVDGNWSNATINPNATNDTNALGEFVGSIILGKVVQKTAQFSWCPPPCGEIAGTIAGAADLLNELIEMSGFKTEKITKYKDPFDLTPRIDLKTRQWITPSIFKGSIVIPQ